VNAFVRRSVEAGFAACLGILGGLSVSWLRPHGPRRDPNEAPPTPLPEVPLPAAHGEEALAVQRPPDVAPRAPAPAPTGSEPTQRASAPPPAEPMELEDQLREADRMHELQHESALRHHRDEPRDPRWASATETKLEGDLQSVAAASKFKIVRVDCRTTTCVSVLEWRSYGEAVRSYGATLRHAYAVNCAQEVLLLPPTNPAATYQASMIFDCESWRAAGN
jgi:hypothetical protein